jgi:hypothetical protein
MTTIATCSNIAEAEILKSVLSDAGIAASLPEELTANSAPHLVFTSGLRVQVEDEDADDARRLLAAAQIPPPRPNA